MSAAAQEQIFSRAPRAAEWCPGVNCPRRCDARTCKCKPCTCWRCRAQTARARRGRVLPLPARSRQGYQPRLFFPHGSSTTEGVVQ